MIKIFSLTSAAALICCSVLADTTDRSRDPLNSLLESLWGQIFSETKTLRDISGNPQEKRRRLDEYVSDNEDLFKTYENGVEVLHSENDQNASMGIAQRLITDEESELSGLQEELANALDQLKSEDPIIQRENCDQLELLNKGVFERVEELTSVVRAQKELAAALDQLKSESPIPELDRDRSELDMLQEELHLRTAEAKSMSSDPHERIRRVDAVSEETAPLIKQIEKLLLNKQR